MMTRIDFTLYLEIAGHYAQIGIFFAFVVACFLLWRMTCRISTGFNLIGRIVTILMFVALLLMGFGPDRVTLFRLLVYTSLSTWIFYAVWYFHKYPIPAEYLKASRSIEMPSSPAFLPKMALMRYLVGESPVLKQPWWFSSTFRNIGIVLGAVFLLSYGFVQTINGYAWGFKHLANQRQQATQETSKAVRVAVKAAIDSTTKTFYAVADTLRKGQTNISRQVKENGEQDQKRANSVQKDLRIANARASRPASLIINAPVQRSLQPSNFKLSPPAYVPPATPYRKGGRGNSFGYESGPFDLEQPVDSTAVARKE